MTPQQFRISRAESARTVAEVLRGRLRLSWSQARRLVQDRRVRLAGQTCTDPAWRVKSGQRLEVVSDRKKPGDQPPSKRRAPAPTHKTSPSLPPNIAEPSIRYVDDQILVVDKPAGLTTMRHPEESAEFGSRARRFLPPTLADFLPELLAKSRGRIGKGAILPIHRLDKETSGLVVFARTSEAARHLGRQFRAHAIERHYLALVRGKPTSSRIESFLVADRGDGRRGSSKKAADGKLAVTNVSVVEELGPHTLVECRLETGRTHQVRIHLGEAGTPLCGDHIYDRPLHGAPLPDESQAKRPMLHAARLGFLHPRTGKFMAWDTPLPPDMARLLKQLRKRAGGDSKAVR